MTLDLKAWAAAIFDPGATEGLKGDRTLTEWQTDSVMRALSAAPSGQAPLEGVDAIYIASKTKHADRWRKIASVHPVSSTWIYEAGEGQSADLNDLWRRCLLEAATSKALVAYREDGEVFKGGWVEIGAALAHGVPVHAVGLEEFTIAKFNGITHHRTMKEAVAAALKEPRRSALLPASAEPVAVGWAYQDEVWMDDGRWHLCQTEPRAIKGRTVKRVYLPASPPASGAVEAGWQDMSSAPKDTRIWAWGDNWGWRYGAVAVFHSDFNGHKDVVTAGGVAGTPYRVNAKDGPTHWTPLPAAPTEGR